MGKKEKSIVTESALVSCLRSRCRRWSLHFGGVLLFVSFFMILLFCFGCNDVERHRILTFFFEGVPSIDDAFRPVKVRRKSGGSVAVAGLDPFAARLAEQRAGLRHEPAGECNKCHRGQMGAKFNQLTKPMPGLCYSCHDDFEAAGGTLHGPVAVGACAFCHNPHQSSYVHLQKAAQPELCFLCHQREDMPTILDHENKLETICTDCHDPHTSSMKKLLKPQALLVADPNSVNSVEIPQDDPNSVKLVDDPNSVK